MQRVNRRHFLEASAYAAALASGLVRANAAQAADFLTPGLPDGVKGYATMATLPGKKPLIMLADRPPNYESPLEYLQTPITPNDQFFVRYHLSDIPEVDVATYKINLGGDGASGQAEFSLDDLKKLPAVEVVAVNQCSGNRRGLSQPHVAGVQWGSGAMGCARWKGAKLKDILDRAGLKKEAIEIAFDGADGPVVEKTPDFIKSIPVWKALEDTTIVAYEMNGEPLPHLNGFPARLIVPGWTGTYWMKHLVKIEARTKPLGNFWMNPAYRVPSGKFPTSVRFESQETAANVPITEMVVNSLITSHRDGARIGPGKVIVSGLAWDGGYGIDTVQVSMDVGQTWGNAKLGDDLGRYAFRPWGFELDAKPGKNTIMVNASNKIGQHQTRELIFNPAGYHNNIMQSITLDA